MPTFIMFVIIMTLSMIVWVFYTLDSYEIDSETAKMCKEVNSGDPSPDNEKRCADDDAWGYVRHANALREDALRACDTEIKEE